MNELEYMNRVCDRLWDEAESFYNAHKNAFEKLSEDDLSSYLNQKESYLRTAKEVERLEKNPSESSPAKEEDARIKERHVEGRYARVGEETFFMVYDPNLPEEKQRVEDELHRFLNQTSRKKSFHYSKTDRKIETLLSRAGNTMEDADDWLRAVFEEDIAARDALVKSEQHVRRLASIFCGETLPEGHDATALYALHLSNLIDRLCWALDSQLEKHDRMKKAFLIAAPVALAKHTRKERNEEDEI